jgi:hypothetical protein
MISFSAFILVEVLHELSLDMTLRGKANLNPFVMLQVFFFLDWVKYMWMMSNYSSQS